MLASLQHPHPEAGHLAKESLSRLLTASPRRFVQRLRRLQLSDTRTRSILLAIGGAAFVAAAWTGFDQLPPRTGPVNWWLMATVPLVGVPLTVLLNAAEYRCSARLVRHKVTMSEAIEISILSTAANLLPVPGAVVVRSRALTKAGTGLGHAVTATTAAGVAWLGVTLAAIALLWVRAEPRLAVFTALAAISSLLAFVVLVRRLRPVGDRRYPALVLILVEVGAVAIAAVRYLIILAALGAESASVAQATALTSGAVVASALGILPGGLGLREALVAGIAPLVGLASASGLAATAIDRLAGLAVLALITLAMLASRHRYTRGRALEQVPD